MSWFSQLLVWEYVASLQTEIYNTLHLILEIVIIDRKSANMENDSWEMLVARIQQCLAVLQLLSSCNFEPSLFLIEHLNFCSAR